MGREVRDLIEPPIAGDLVDHHEPSQHGQGSCPSDDKGLDGGPTGGLALSLDADEEEAGDAGEFTCHE